MASSSTPPCTLPTTCSPQATLPAGRTSKKAKTVRAEHWTNAAEQGAAAGRNLLAGRESAEPYDPVPYIWSDQYDVKIQVLGDPGPDDTVRGRRRLVRRGPIRRCLRAFGQAHRSRRVRPAAPAHGVPPLAQRGRDVRSGSWICWRGEDTRFRVDRRTCREPQPDAPKRRRPERRVQLSAYVGWWFAPAVGRGLGHRGHRSEGA